MTDLGTSIRVRARTIAVLSLVLDLPMLAPLVRRLTKSPTEESIDVAGVPVTIVRPAGRGPFPAIMFVTGAHPLRRKEPIVQRVAHGLARAGYLVVLPDLPGLGLGELTSETVDAAVAIVHVAVERPDVRGGKVALIGASAGASIALLVAARPDLAHRISGVSSVTPFADLRKMICLATTARYENASGYRDYGVTNLLRRAVARSMMATLPARTERERLLAAVGDILEEDDPFARLPADADQLGPEAGAIVRVLANRDTARFTELYDELPPHLRAVIEQLSPLSVAAEVRAPVELAVPPNDPYFPIDEAETLARSLPNVRLTVTSTLDHTRPGASLKQLDELRRFDRFVVRTLAAAAS
jgi:pimeloyl-ACP methyl ester carboxylesterase